MVSNSFQIEYPVWVTEVGTVRVSHAELADAGLRWGRGTWRHHLVPRKAERILDDFIRLAAMDEWLNGR
jgi:hypothetical protein